MKFADRGWRLLLGFGLCLVAPGSAQVIDISGGTSTAYESTGGTVTIHGLGSETSIGGGVSQGHFGLDGQTVRPLNGGVLTTGQQQLRVELPTDVFDTAHVISGIGFGFRTPQTANAGLQIFSGFTSLENGGALFRTSSLTGPLGVVQWRRAMTERCSLLSTGILSSISSVLASVECRPSRTLTYAATVGIGAQAPYLGASVRWQSGRLKLRAAYLYANQRFNRGGDDTVLPVPEPTGANAATDFKLTRSFSLTGMHEQFFTPAYSGDAAGNAGLGLFGAGAEPAAAVETSSVDQAGIAYQHRGTGVSASILRSRYHQDASATASAADGSDVGYQVGAQREFGRFRLNEEWLESRANDDSMQSLLISNLTVKVNAHLRYTQGMNYTNGGTNFSEGGEFVTSFSSFRLDYQLYYLPNRPGAPFQQSMVFEAEMHLFRKLFLQASSNIDPAGRTVYTINVGSQYVRNGAAHVTTPGGVSGFAVTGHVVDETSGNPVEGAAVLIGGQRCYTDSDGNFSFREAHRASHTLRVLTDEFLQVGRYVLISAPTTVTSVSADQIGVLVEIRVARVMGPGTAFAVQAKAEALDLGQAQAQGQGPRPSQTQTQVQGESQTVAGQGLPGGMRP